MTTKGNNLSIRLLNSSIDLPVDIISIKKDKDNKTWVNLSMPRDNFYHLYMQMIVQSGGRNVRKSTGSILFGIPEDKLDNFNLVLNNQMTVSAA